MRLLICFHILFLSCADRPIFSLRHSSLPGAIFNFLLSTTLFSTKFTNNPLGGFVIHVFFVVEGYSLAGSALMFCLQLIFLALIKFSSLRWIFMEVFPLKILEEKESSRVAFLLNLKFFVAELTSNFIFYFRSWILSFWGSKRRANLVGHGKNFRLITFLPNSNMKNKGVEKF